MSLSSPRSVFGVHSVSPYSRADGLFYGIIKCLQSSSIALSGELIDLFAGSNKYQWASEEGKINAEMTLKVSQMEDFMYTLFLGVAPTATTGETTGNVSTLTNKKGSSVVSSVGLASVAATAADEADLKFGKYIIKALDATHIEVYVSSDADFKRGNSGSYINDALKILSSTVVSTGGAIVLAAYGLTITGGAGTIGMTAGDTATFYVRPINSKASVATVGGAGNTFPEFGAIIMAQKQGSDQLYEIEAFRVKASGMPQGFESFKWSEPEVKAKLLYDSAQDGVFNMRSVIV